MTRDERPPLLTMYGTDTCADCRRTRALLDPLGIVYTWVDIGEDATAAEYVLATNGRTSTPYIEFCDGTRATEPTDAELAAKLTELGALQKATA